MDGWVASTVGGGENARIRVWREVRSRASLYELLGVVARLRLEDWLFL